MNRPPSFTEWCLRETVAIAVYESHQRYLRDAQAVDSPDAPFLARSWPMLTPNEQDQWRHEVEFAASGDGGYMIPKEER